MKKKYIKMLLPLCGALAALPLVFTDISILAFLLFAPGFYLIRLSFDEKATLRGAYLSGFLFTFGYFAVVFHWFVSMYPLEFADIGNAASAGIVAVAWLGLSLLQCSIYAFFIPLLLIFSRTGTAKRFPVTIPLAAGALWTVFSYFQSLTWAGVPWGRIALSQYENLFTVSSASIFGSHFVEYIIVTVGACVAFALPLPKSAANIKTASRRLLLCTAGGLFLFNVILSSAVYLAPVNTDRQVRVAVLQGNYTSNEKWAVSFEETYATYCNLAADAANEGAEIIVWPETAITRTLYLPNSSIYKLISSVAKQTGCINIVGAFSEACEDDDGNEIDRVSLFLFYPDGTCSETVYSKRRLVPFGEYVPLEDLVMAVFPALGSMGMFDDPLLPGDGTNVFYEEDGNIGSLICFDSIYPSLTRDSVLDGAELMIISTNDSWFKDSAAVYQHNAQAVLRAIESGRCIARSANTGISSLINSKGEIISQTEPLVRGYLVGDLYYSSGQTLYMTVGDTFVLLCGVFALLPTICDIALYFLRRSKAKRETQKHGE